ncbi:MAG: M20/M25/M40 family metallo-hydrolase [Candidatus Cloacimonetes bacterium]|nr:M20/M25/M40 family metallo-hydrolase [Candidatus Cloacimonadota bacterium]
MENTLDSYFISLVKIDSLSKQEKNVAQKIAQDLKDLGAEVKFDLANEKTGGNIGNLYAYFPGNVKKEPLLFCSHLDTVVPGKNIKPQIKDDRITSDGTTILGSDDKSGIAEIIWAIKEIKEEGTDHAPIEVLLTISEEIGLLGAKYLDYSMIRSRIGYAMDSHKIGEMVVGAPSQNTMFYTIYGKESHAGIAPEMGINAIKIASEAISKMPMGRIDFETTCNVGVIEGGKATNIVPNIVKIKAEARSHNMSKLNDVTERMSKALKDAVEKYEIGDYKASVEIEINEEYQSFFLSDEEEVIKLGKKASENLGLDTETIIGGGGSDANILNQNGLKIVVAGTGMNQVHTVDEFILLADLKNGVKWIKEVIRIHSLNCGIS